MSAVKEKALAKYIGLLYVAPYTTGTPVYQRMGSVRAMANKLTLAQTEVNADDTGTVLVFSRPECVIEGTFLENFDVALLDIVLPGTRTNTAGSATPVTAEILLDYPTIATWAINQMLPAAFKNGDGTKVSSIVVKHGAATLVLNTDYAVVLMEDGRTGIARIGAALTLTGDITIDYSYTPNASANFAFTNQQMEIPKLIVKIEAADPDDITKKRIITLSGARFSGDYVLDFLDVVEAGDVNGSSFSFDLDKGGTFLMQDQILPTP